MGSRAKIPSKPFGAAPALCKASRLSFPHHALSRSQLLIPNLPIFRSPLPGASLHPYWLLPPSPHRPPSRHIPLNPLPGSLFYFLYRFAFCFLLPFFPIVSTVKSQWSKLKEAPVPSHSLWVGPWWWVGGTEQVLGSLP